MAEGDNSKKITIHTDGACDGNPGPGGWAAVLRFGAHVRELTGGEPATTNNRMELQAAISALTALKAPCEVTLFTDSEYLRGAFPIFFSPALGNIVFQLLLLLGLQIALDGSAIFHFELQV